MQLAELFVKLGVKADDNKLKSFDKGFKSLIFSASKVVAAVAATTSALVVMNNELAKSVQTMQTFNQLTGLSVDKLQEFQFSAQLANINLSPQQIQSSLQSLQSNLAKISIGQGDASPFFMLGIDPLNKDAFEIVDELRERIQGLSPAMASNLMQATGLSPEFINILKMTKSEFEGLNKEFFLNKEQRANILAFGQSVKTMTMQFDLFKQQIMAEITPALSVFIADIVKFGEENREDIIKGISAAIKIFLEFAEAIWHTTEFIAKLIGGIGKFLDKINLLKPLLAGLATFLLIKFAPVHAMILGIMLLIDDLMTHFEGGDSITGDIVKFFSGMKLPEIANMGMGGFMPVGSTLQPMSSNNMTNNININTSAPIDKAGVDGLNLAMLQAQRQFNMAGV